jgi:WXG100 family type VII secretion target
MLLESLREAVPVAQPTSVDIAGMTAAQQNFQSAVDEVNTAYQSMEMQQSSLAAIWTGETSTAFGQALTQWLEDFGVVRTQLQNMLETLSSNTGVYANTNEEATATAQKVASSIGGLPGL